MTLPATLGFWESAEMVKRFANRDPDHRLLELIEQYPNPEAVRVLDLGCAAGRNTVLLARRGFDVAALDAAHAMVAETRRRVGEVLGSEEAEARVRQGRMDDLGAFDSGSMDLVVALGVYHAAASRSEWDRALEESFRVLARGGRLLVANHTPGFSPVGVEAEPVPGEPGLYDGFPSGRSFLIEAPELDREMARVGAYPLVPTRTVERRTSDGGRRVTVNGLYLKP
jgi:SAM-dependent methyltransferase